MYYGYKYFTPTVVMITTVLSLIYACKMFYHMLSNNLSICFVAAAAATKAAAAAAVVTGISCISVPLN